MWKIIAILGVGAPPWGKSWIRHWFMNDYWIISPSPGPLLPLWVSSFQLNSWRLIKTSMAAFSEKGKLCVVKSGLKFPVIIAFCQCMFKTKHSSVDPKQNTLRKVGDDSLRNQLSHTSDPWSFQKLTGQAITDYFLCEILFVLNMYLCILR